MSLIDLPVYDAAAWDMNTACAGVDPDMFIPDRPKPDEVRKLAHTFCGGCPVRSECRERAESLEWRPYGVWGGRWYPGANKGALVPELRDEVDLLELVRA